jgi:glycosyltransferase involved in cell wall biosynthesis
MKIAVIVTTYNRPDALALALEGYLSQKDKDYELIVADDGSTVETEKIISYYQKKNVINIRHVWQEDKGFRAAAIRNRAIAETFADYIIFSDGDCVPLPDFVGQHKSLAEKNWFVAGSRILLSAAFTLSVLQEQIPVYNWRMSQWILARIKNDINRLSPFFSLPIGNLLRKVTPNSWSGVMTCNMAVWRTDLIKINGFDESYTGWGLEDSDITIRLIRSKIHRKSARFLLPVLHLWHKENDRSQLLENRLRLNDLVNSDRVYASCGVNQYL